MVLWVIIALLTGAAILSVLAPLGREPRAGGDRSGEAGRIYRDQLRELEKDARDGRIGAAETEAARAEIARRLIAAEAECGSAPAMAGNLRARRAVAVVAIVALPAFALGLYGVLGNPELAGQPLGARLDAPAAGDGLAEMLARVEAHLAKEPEDGRGWDVVAPVYVSLGRPADAVRAYSNAIRLLGSTAARQNGLGEALFMSSGGIVTAEASEAFAAASAADPTAPGPRYFLGLAAEQDGRPDEAAAIWRALLAEAGADAPWRAMVEKELARIETAPAGPAAEEIEAAASMTPAARDEMIEGMVAGLADRLSREPADVEGWLRLIRSYVVLDRRDDATEAAALALSGVADPAGRARIEALMAELGVNLPAAVQ